MTNMNRSVDAGIALYMSPLFLAVFGVLLTPFEYTMLTVAGGLAIWVSSIIADTFWGPIGSWLKEKEEESAKTAFILGVWFVVSYVFLKLSLFMSQMKVTGLVLIPKAILDLITIDWSLLASFLIYFILFIVVREVIAKANYTVFMEFILKNFLPARTLDEKLWYGAMRIMSFITVSIAAATFILLFRWVFITAGWVTL